MGAAPAKAEAAPMTTERSTQTGSSNRNLAARVGRWSVQHRRTAILGWLAFVVAALVIGFNVIPKKTVEQVLVQSKTLKASDSQFKDVVADVSQRLHKVEGVTDIKAGEVSK